MTKSQLSSMYSNIHFLCFYTFMSLLALLEDDWFLTDGSAVSPYTDRELGGLMFPLYDVDL